MSSIEASRVKLHQVLASLTQGGSAELSAGQPAVTALAYVGIAAIASVVLLVHRDVTA